VKSNQASTELIPAMRAVLGVRRHSAKGGNPHCG
jgi:hypothetical protein